MRKLVLIAHDIRSIHNIGSLLRTAEGFGVEHVYCTGYTPYPKVKQDTRLPHIADKITRQIHKTALGAEHTLAWSHHPDVAELITKLRQQNFEIVALEQAENAISLPDYKPPKKVALLLGREVEGIETMLLQRCDVTIEIPMFGNKESFNVVQAAAIALYHCRFANT